MKRKAVQIVLSLTLTAAMCFGAPAMAFAGETTAKEESTDKTEAKDSTEEKEEAKKDMGRMLDYIDKLNELDTTGVEPMSHVFPVNNVFREDVVTNGDDRDEILANAPAKKDGAFMVPKTVE